MTKKEALDEARIQAKHYHMKFAVVYAPVEMRSNTVPFTLCPVEAVKILFPWGNIVEIVSAVNKD